MPFVPDSNFEKKEKVEALKEQILKKKEQAYINDQAKEDQPKKPLKLDNAKIIKQVLKNTNMMPKDKPKIISLKDIKDSLKIEKLIEDEKVKEIEQILDNAEIQEVKGEFVNLLAIPHTNPVKRRIFANKLQQSRTVNNYVDNNLVLRMFNKANENLKFGVVYAIKYLETNKDYDSLLLMQQIKEAQLKKQKEDEAKEHAKEQAKEQATETPKDETKE